MEPEESNTSAAGNARRKPTLRQLRFAAAYVDPSAANGNGVAAARSAGYRGDARQLAVQACNNLKNPTVQQTIAKMLDEMVAPALERLSEAIDATKSRSFMTETGDIVSSAPEPDHKTRLEAIKLVFQLRQVCGTGVIPNHVADRNADVVVEDHDTTGSVRALQQMPPADRLAFREAGEIEEQLAEVERELTAEERDEDAAKE